MKNIKSLLGKFVCKYPVAILAGAVLGLSLASGNVLYGGNIKLGVIMYLVSYFVVIPIIAIIMFVIYVSYTRENKKNNPTPCDKDDNDTDIRISLICEEDTGNVFGDDDDVFGDG